MGGDKGLHRPWGAVHLKNPVMKSAKSQQRPGALAASSFGRLCSANFRRLMRRINTDYKGTVFIV